MWRLRRSGSEEGGIQEFKNSRIQEFGWRGLGVLERLRFLEGNAEMKARYEVEILEFLNSRILDSSLALHSPRFL
jgi:hypothetical protein